MIEGLKLDISTEELRKTLTERADFHERKMQAYVEQLTGLETARAGTKDLQFSSDPRLALENAISNHKQKSGFFRFLADHLIPNEVYRLSEHDLTSLELIDRYL